MRTDMKNTIWILALVVFGFQSCDRNENARDSFVGGEAKMEEMETADDYSPEEAKPMYQRSEGNIVTTTGLYRDAVTNAATDSEDEIELPKQPVRKTNDKIIRTGNIGIQVKDYAKDKHPFYDAIRKHEGYISRENERNETNRISNDIEIRVPNENFDALVNAITKGEGVKSIDYKRISAVDVGEEFYDLQTRIKTKKEVEKRYIEILRSAKEIKDILAVEDQIRVIREEIESKEGRLRFLSDRISYSTITLYLYQELDYDAPLVDQPTFWGKMANAGKTGWNAILNFILFLVYIWPVMLLLGVIVVLYKRKMFIFKNRK